MNKSSLLKTTLLTTVLLVLSVPAMANVDAKTKSAEVPVSKADLFYQKQLNKADEMMGQIALARKSLNIGMDKDASYHLAKAQDLASQLEKKSPEVATTSTLRYNDKVYSFNDKYKDYLIPAVDDLFTIKDYDAKLKSDVKKDRITEEDAGVGRYQLELDIRNVQEALKKSKEEAQKGEINKARNALNEVYKGAVENSVVYADPIWIVHDNLMVANAMIKDKDFNGARYALKKAQSELKTLQKHDDYADDSKTLKRLEKEAADLHESLGIDDPSLLQEAEDKISGWLKDVRGIGNKHAKSRTVAKK